MDVRYKTLEKQIFQLNEDEKFYRDYYEAGHSSRGLQAFLSGVDKEDVVLGLVAALPGLSSSS